MTRQPMLSNPVRASLVMDAPDRRRLWLMQVRTGLPGASRILRNLIRGTTQEQVNAMTAHFAAGIDGQLRQPSRPTALLEAADLKRLDELVTEAAAPSRSAVIRFLVRTHSEGLDG
jgi:hypothetical protein